MPQISRAAILDALVTTLKGITGPTTYHINLSNRVYRRLREPTSIEEGEFPILFVIEDDENTPYRNDEHGLKTSILVAIIGMTRETSQDEQVTSAATDASKLHDDICKAVLGNLNLSGTVTGRILFRQAGVFAGVDPVYAFTRVELEIPYHFFRANLGPAP